MASRHFSAEEPLIHQEFTCNCMVHSHTIKIKRLLQHIPGSTLSLSLFLLSFKISPHNKPTSYQPPKQIQLSEILQVSMSKSATFPHILGKAQVISNNKHHVLQPGEDSVAIADPFPLSRRFAAVYYQVTPGFQPHSEISPRWNDSGGTVLYLFPLKPIQGHGGITFWILSASQFI